MTLTGKTDTVTRAIRASLNPDIDHRQRQHRSPDVKATPGKDIFCVHDMETRKSCVRVPPVTNPYYVLSTAFSSLSVTIACVNKLLSNVAVKSNNVITRTGFTVFDDSDSCMNV